MVDFGQNDFHKFTVMKENSVRVKLPTRFKFGKTFVAWVFIKSSCDFKIFITLGYRCYRNN